MGTPTAPIVRQLSAHLYLVEDICNVYVLTQGSRALLIDSGLGLVAEVLDELGITQVEWVLHTHFHRDQCDGTVAFTRMGAQVAVPQAEMSYFAAAETFWRTRAIFDNANTYNDFFAPTTSIPVNRALGDYEIFTWQDIALRVIPAPGHTKGSVILCGEVDGRRVAFAGDVIHHSARPWTLFDLEWGYGHQIGVRGLSHTLQALAALHLDVILPSHGDPLLEPTAACTTLNAKLRAYDQWLQMYGPQREASYALLPWDALVQPLTPHLWVNTTAYAQSYALVTDDGTAMFLDYGFPSAAHFSANLRFAEHTLDELRRVAGLQQIDVVVPSHYHDDHVGGVQYLYTHHGAKLWVFENQADILSHPEAYKIPCLWARPLTVARVLREGETFRWQGTTFAALKTPGHTEYHGALCFEVDGRRVAFAGDTFEQGPTGPCFGGPIFQNRFKPGDFVESVTKLRDFEPEFILTGHHGVLRVERPFLDEALVRARALNDIMWDLIAVPEAAGFALDPNWATLYPYQATACPGETTLLTVRLINHLSTAAMARVVLRLPDDWTSEAPAPGVEIDGGAQGSVHFTIKVPETAVVGERHIILALVTLGERPFGPVAEGHIRIVPRSTPDHP